MTDPVTSNPTSHGKRKDACIMPEWALMALTVLLLVSINGLAHSTELNELRYISEDSPPFNYLENGVLKGPAVELLIAATTLAGSPVALNDILVQPWARGLRNAREGPNTVLFNTIRTAEREQQFKWAGPTGTEHYVLIARIDRCLDIHAESDLQRYAIGVVRKDAGEDYLHALHINKSHIISASNVANLGKMLLAGRIDLWAFGNSGWQQSLQSAGIDAGNFEVVYTLKKNDYYFAFSLDTEDRLVQQMQNALNQLAHSGPSVTTEK